MIANFWNRLNPTLRGFVVILVIAGIVTALSLDRPLEVLFILVRIAFFLAIAFFLFLIWRERREEVAAWPMRQKTVLYGGAALAVVNLALAFWPSLDYPSGGLEVVIFIAVLVAAGYSMFRVWRDQTSYGYY